MLLVCLHRMRRSNLSSLPSMVLAQLSLAKATTGFLLLLLAVSIFSFASPTPQIVAKLPHLEYSSRTSVLLGADEIWEPGFQTLITTMRFGRPLMVRLNLTVYQKPFVPPISYLMFKCSSDDTAYQELNITHDNQLDSQKVHCRRSRAFTLNKLESNPRLFVFNFTLHGQHNNVSFEQSMRHSLELRVRVEFREGTDLSASLFVYNLDSLSKLNSKPFMSSGHLITRYILSPQGAAFLTALAAPSGPSLIDNVQLLDKEFLKAIRRSPIFIRPMLSVSVMLINSDKQCEVEATVDDRILFTTGDSDPDIAQFLFTQPNYFIEIQTGVLTYSRQALQQGMSSLLDKAKSQVIRVCIRVSLNPAVWGYRLALQVADLQITPGGGGGGGAAPNKPGPNKVDQPLCRSYKNRDARWVMFSQGMRDAVLMSPVICSDRTKEVTKVSFNNQECTNYLDLSAHKWQSCGHYNLAQYGNAVQLRGPVSLAHAGQYKFSVLDTVFTFYVTVFSMPLFQTLTQNGSLPQVTYANLDMSVTFNCTAHHDGLKYVSIDPIFRVVDPFKPGSQWQELSLSDFATGVLKMAPSSIEKQVTQVSKRRTADNLYIRMPEVTDTWKTWRLAFICRAKVDKSDVERMGLPEYTVETRTNVVYYGWRIASSSGRSAYCSPSGRELFLLFFYFYLKSISVAE